MEEKEVIPEGKKKVWHYICDHCLSEFWYPEPKAYYCIRCHIHKLRLLGIEYK